MSLPSNTAVDIFASARSAAVLLADGRIFAVGDNPGSRVTCNTSQTDQRTPVQLTTMTNLKEVDFGSFHSILLTTDKKVYTCGRSYATTGVAGNASFHASISSAYEYTNGPILMDDIGQQGRAIAVRATGTSSFILLDNSSVACVGSNGSNQCNHPDTSSAYQPTPMIMPGL